MNDIEKPTSVGGDGSGNHPRKPWEIANMLICQRDSKKINVLNATDEEFQEFIVRAGISVNDNGIAAWSFEDRCGVINAAIYHDITLPLIGAKQFGNDSDSAELFEVTQPAREATPQGAHDAATESVEAQQIGEAQ